MSTNEAVFSMQMAFDDIRECHATNILKTEWWQNWNAGDCLEIPPYSKSSLFECGTHGYYTLWAFRNLGVIMDTDFTMEPHLNKTM